MDLKLFANLLDTMYRKDTCISNQPPTPLVFLPEHNQYAFWNRSLVRAFNPFPNKSLFLRVCYTSLLKTLWRKKKKEKNAHNEQFLLFQRCFLSFRLPFRYFHQIQNCRLQTLSVWNSLKFAVGERD